MDDAQSEATMIGEKLDGLNLFSAVYNEDSDGGLRFVPYRQMVGHDGSKDKAAAAGKTDEEASLGGPVFEPRLYIQRYDLVCDIINKSGIQPTSVLDFGAAECKLLSKLKNAVPTLQRIIGVDIDKWVLESNAFRLQPLPWEHLHKRPPDQPLTMSLYCGSITDTDLRCCPVDVVTCVEIVEHLTDDVLQKVPNAIFGRLKPKLVIVTTPNSEYNILFPDFTGFRHWDHKFEWTRLEFKHWCDGVVSEYSEYRVEYTGVGDVTPDCVLDVGYCTQIAVFSRVTHEVSSLQPQTASLQPDTASLQPETASLQPHATSLQPETSSVQPETESLQPETSSLQPETSSLQPETSSLQPHTTSLQPDTASCHTVIDATYSGSDMPYELVCEVVYPTDSINDIIDSIAGALYYTLHDYAKRIVDEFESCDLTSPHLTVTASQYVITVQRGKLVTDTLPTLRQYQHQYVQAGLEKLVSSSAYDDVSTDTDTGTGSDSIVHTMPVFPPDSSDTDTDSEVELQGYTGTDLQSHQKIEDSCTINGGDSDWEQT